MLYLNPKTLIIEVQHNAAEEYIPCREVAELQKQCLALKAIYESKKAEIDALFRQYTDSNILPELQSISKRIEEINKNG